MPAVAETFAREINRTAQAPLSDAVAREAKRSFFNVLGLAAGAAGHEGVDAIVATARQLGSSRHVPILGRIERADAHFAALAMGFAAHVDDFDDTHLATVIHPGAATLAVVAALAEETAPSGALALMAFALGCESQLRVGVSISPEHYDRGWHITGTCGVIGAAVAASLLYGFDDATLARAIRLATSMTLGHREAFGTMTKPFHPGKAASNGIMAAILARSGADAPAEVFEGRGGFAAALSTRFDPDQMNGEFGDRWELASNTYKPYPCGIVAHPSIDAALALAPLAGDPSRIVSIEAHCHPLVPELMGNPDPTDGLEARFSAIHGIAVALCDGRVGLAQYETERVRRDDVRAVRAKTLLDPDASIARDEVRIDMRLADGATLQEHVTHARGSLERPLTDKELFDKVEMLVEPRFGPGVAQALSDAVRSLEKASSLDALIALTIPKASVARA
jgi:2-methylcitrate dehydratase PrpD